MCSFIYCTSRFGVINYLAGFYAKIGAADAAPIWLSRCFIRSAQIMRSIGIGHLIWCAHRIWLGHLLPNQMGFQCFDLCVSICVCEEQINAVISRCSNKNTHFWMIKVEFWTKRAFETARMSRHSNLSMTLIEQQMARRLNCAHFWADVARTTSIALNCFAFFPKILLFTATKIDVWSGANWRPIGK